MLESKLADVAGHAAVGVDSTLKALGAGGAKTVGTGGLKTFAASASPWIGPVLGVFALAGIIGFEFWKGNRDAKAFQEKKA